MKVETIEIYYTNTPGDGGPLQHTRPATIEVMAPLLGLAGTLEEVSGGHLAAGTYLAWTPNGGQWGKLFIRSNSNSNVLKEILDGDIIPVLVQPKPKAVAPYGRLHQNQAYYTA